MSISVNGQSQVPPGFRFHPSEEELLHYYLKKKIFSENIDLDVIQDVDLNKLEPWDIQEKCRIGSTPQNDWYFFSHKDKKYPTGTRTNRATASGFWKATGRDKVIYGSSRRIGMRKTLVFYTGRAPHGRKSDWIMHEYRLDTNGFMVQKSNIGDGTTQDEGGWVVCRVFRKKSHVVSHKSPANGTTTNWQAAGRTVKSGGDETLEKIIESMGRNQLGTPDDIMDKRFLKLPSLLESQPTCYQPDEEERGGGVGPVICEDRSRVIPDWTALDRLVASHLNGHAYNNNNNNNNNGLKQVSSAGFGGEINAESSEINFCISDIHEEDDDPNEISNELIWSFERYANDQLCGHHIY